MKTARWFRCGFGILEVLIVVAILSLLAAWSYASFFNVNRAQALEKEATHISTVLERARSLTLSAADNQQHGVHLASDRVIVFRGALYHASDPNNLTEMLHPLVTISAISLSGGGSDVVFQRLTGKTSQSGTLTVSLRSDPSRFSTITIVSTGIIE